MLQYNQDIKKLNRVEIFNFTKLELPSSMGLGPRPTPQGLRTAGLY